MSLRLFVKRFVSVRMDLMVFPTCVCMYVSYVYIAYIYSMYIYIYHTVETCGRNHFTTADTKFWTAPTDLTTVPIYTPKIR
jgi:hypothetical protein